MQEKWRPIPSLGGRYLVSNQGRIQNVKTGRFLKTWLDGGYYRVSLIDANGKQRSYRIHRLVAEAFIGPCPNDMIVRHLDGNPENNNLENLAYGTASENVRDTINAGTRGSSRKAHCPQGHPYDETNTRIDGRGARVCRTCIKEYDKEWRRTHKRVQVNGKRTSITRSLFPIQ